MDILVFILFSMSLIHVNICRTLIASCLTNKGTFLCYLKKHTPFLVFSKYSIAEVFNASAFLYLPTILSAVKNNRGLIYKV